MWGQGKTGYHIALILATTVCSSALAAQDRGTSDARWLDHCRDQSDEFTRVRYCEVRVVSLGRSTGAISVDGRQNGGIEVMGWMDSVVAHILVEAEARTEATAREIASQVQVTTTTSPAVRGRNPTHPRLGGVSLGGSGTPTGCDRGGVHIPRGMMAQDTGQSL